MKTLRTIVAVLCSAALTGFAGACSTPGAPSPLAPPATASAGIRAASSPGVEMNAVRAATARFHNIDAAGAAGYVDDGFGCIDATTFGLDPALGGMGFHLINDRLHADPDTDPLQPDLLVYAPAKANGQPRLVALEYEVFVDDWYALKGNGATPPSLFGRQFERIDLDDLHVFGLHLWLWEDNPNGLFEDFNPRVSCQ